jgi:hypothetical protein
MPRRCSPRSTATDSTVAASWQHIRPLLVALVDLDQEEASEALAAIQRMVRPMRPRGGDPRAEQRRQRDEAICALASLTGKGKSIERQARDIAQRLDRYCPMPVETTPERRLMQEIKESKLPVGQRRISKILRDQTGVLDAQQPARD